MGIVFYRAIAKRSKGAVYHRNLMVAAILFIFCFVLPGGAWMQHNAEVDGEYRITDMRRAAYGLGSTLGVSLPYSRSHELEADKLGLIYMARAGYDPRRTLVFWERMMQNQRAGILPEFLSTHPAHQSRIASLKANMEWAMAEYDATRPLEDF